MKGNSLVSKIKNKLIRAVSAKDDGSIAGMLNEKQPKNGLTVLLTQYKRRNLAEQLQSVFSQTLKPDRVVVFQNEDHVDVSKLKERFDFDFVFSSYNTKYFGRFAYCLSLDSDYFIVMDDDVLPGRKCFEVYVDESKRLNAIVGGNGRIAFRNPRYEELIKPPDIGVRELSVLVDFVGHVWVFKKAWLYDMFSVPPCTLSTGEDMHLCFSAKIKSGIPSYVCMQRNEDELSDRSYNKLAVDHHSSFKSTPQVRRLAVEEYFQGLGLDFIQQN